MNAVVTVQEWPYTTISNDTCLHILLWRINKLVTRSKVSMKHTSVHVRSAKGLTMLQTWQFQFIFSHPDKKLLALCRHWSLATTVVMWSCLWLRSSCPWCWKWRRKAPFHPFSSTRRSPLSISNTTTSTVSTTPIHPHPWQCVWFSWLMTCRSFC